MSKFWRSALAIGGMPIGLAIVAIALVAMTGYQPSTPTAWELNGADRSTKAVELPTPDPHAVYAIGRVWIADAVELVEMGDVVAAEWLVNRAVELAEIAPVDLTTDAYIAGFRLADDGTWIWPVVPDALRVKARS